MDLLKEVQEKRASRRSFVAGALAASAAGVMAGCSSGAPSTVVNNPQVFVDSDYLNFALNLEYLEASYYLYAATGTGLASSLMSGAGTAGTVTATGAGAVPGLTTQQQQIINEIANDEMLHVKFLRGALGALAVAIPNISISVATFQAAATAAKIPTASSFNPYSGFTSFLLGAFIFEDVGVTAYSGAAPALTSAANLNYAAGIQAVEAYHASYVRTSITALDPTNPGLISTANLISALRSALGGGNETPLTGGTTTGTTTTYPATGTSIVAATTANAIAFARSTDQVLHIVYGAQPGAGVSSGLFFPSGLNGNIKTTAS